MAHPSVTPARISALALLLAAAIPGPPARGQVPAGIDASAPRLPPPALLQDQPPRTHVGRALLEALLVQAGGTVWYWQDLDFNARDWDLRWDWASWKRKLLSTEPIRFDQNQFGTNARWHPMWGTVNYHIARGNGLHAGTSFLFSVGTGVFWEYVVESREYPSLNDLVVNPTAGFALGEPLYQLGAFFGRSSPNAFNRTLAGVLSPVVGMNDWVDGHPRTHDAVDSLGLSQERWHHFQLSARLGSRTFDRATVWRETGVSLGAELVMLPGYGRPQDFARWVAPGAWSAVSAELEASEGGALGGSVLTRTSVAGRYWQRLRRADDGRLRGAGLLLGLGSGFEYDDHDRPDGRDFLAVMNVLGPTWELRGYRDGLALRFRGDAFGDFAMVRSLALAGVMPAMTGDVYHPRDSGGVMPGVVGARGYYYALGVTAGTRLELAWRAWDTGAETRGDHFGSIAGADRFREEITREVTLVDRRITSRVWLGVRPWGRTGRVAAGLEWRWRQGRVLEDDLQRQRLDGRAYLQLALVF